MGNSTADERVLRLTLAERYALVGLLPRQGDFATLTRTKNLSAVLELSEAEAERRELKVTQAGIQGATPEAVERNELNAETEINVSNGQHDLIVAALKGAESGRALPMSALSLYEKVVREPDNDAIREAEAIARQAEQE